MASAPWVLSQGSELWGAAGCGARVAGVFPALARIGLEIGVNPWPCAGSKGVGMTPRCGREGSNSILQEGARRNGGRLRHPSHCPEAHHWQVTSTPALPLSFPSPYPDGLSKPRAHSNSPHGIARQQSQHPCKPGGQVARTPPSEGSSAPQGASPAPGQKAL